eukprot:188928-Prymnesium_polylepis.1
MLTSTASAEPGGVYGTLVPRMGGMNVDVGAVTCCQLPPVTESRNAKARVGSSSSCCRRHCLLRAEACSATWEGGAWAAGWNASLSNRC